MQDERVDYSTFADRFSDMFAHFQAVYEQEKQGARENAQVVDAGTNGASTNMDVSTSSIHN